MSDKKKNKKQGGDNKKQLQPFHTLLIAIVIIVAAILIGQAIKDSGQATNEGAPEENQEEQMVEEGEETDEQLANNGEETGDRQPVNTNVMALEEFEGREQAEKIINSTQGQRINTPQYETVRGPVLQDAQDETTVYFATGSQNKDPHFVGVYKYDTVTYRWERQHKAEYEAEDDLSAKQLKVIGRTDSKLVLLVDRLDREHGECDSYWLTGTQENYDLKTVKLNTIEGLKDYEIPSEVREQEEARVAECQQ